jgi:hypothetical protein
VFSWRGRGMTALLAAVAARKPIEKSQKNLMMTDCSWTIRSANQIS